ncbi:MAG: beta-galactosidase trimerization domain-containing protein [Clostridia bacterium]|nr:beta-galactosidase trimerization domain-containing protein [Clostridia bacterium]
MKQRQVHLDFHTSEHIDGIGKMFDKENFRHCLEVGHVNSITVFAKCHHGWAYFPSEANTMHPGLHGFDLLSAEIEVCKEMGVSCPIYISAGLDENYLHSHPEHARMLTREDEALRIENDENGKPYIANRTHFQRICFNTPYLDVLKAQVEEVVTKFMPEGIFMDICSEGVCYCPTCRKAVRDMGYDENDDEGFRQLGRITYKKYYTTINEAAKAIKPDIKVFHNGGHISAARRDIAYSNTHLELESLPTGGWGYDHFPKSAKYVQHLGMEYLGMTGKFHFSWGEFGGFKHPNALRYEVALSLAFGAKCSIGDQMHPYGFLDPATYELIGAAYSEAELVEDYCYDIKPISDIAILAVEAVTGARNSRADVGAPRILLEGNYLFDFVDKEIDLSDYKLLIIPEGINLDETLAEKLSAFVKGGGKILASGSSGRDATKHFDLGCEWLGASEYNPAYFNPTYNATGLTPSNYVFYKQMYKTALTDKAAEVLAYGKETFFNRAPEHFCSHRHTPFKIEEGTPGIIVGKDGAYIAWDIFSEYADAGCYSAKEAVIKTIEALIGDTKTLKTNLPSTGVVALNEQPKESRYVLHALFSTPIKRGGGSTPVEVIEDLIPLYDTSFEIKLDKPVKSVVLVPENREIAFTQNDGVLSFKIDKFECKQLAVINV